MEVKVTSGLATVEGIAGPKSDTQHHRFRPRGRQNVAYTWMIRKKLGFQETSRKKGQAVNELSTKP